MLFRKIRINHIIFAVALLLLPCSGALALASFQPGAVDQPSKISKESVDFLTRTGQAMAEIAEAVKPAVVNIATVRTEKAAGMNPLMNDPFFRKFFGDQFRHPDTPKERKASSLGSGVIVSPDGYI